MSARSWKARPRGEAVGAVWIKAALARTVSAAALACASPAAAGEGAMVSAADPQALFEVARGFGSAELLTNSDGDPTIAGRIDGVRYQISFYGCVKGENCSDVVFTARFPAGASDLARLNEWNRTKRFGSAYLDEAGAPSLDMTVNLRHGVSRANWDDTVEWWRIASKSFRDYVGVK